MSTRQSKRLKSASGKAIEVATKVIETTIKTKSSSTSKKSTSTTKKSISTTSKETKKSTADAWNQLFQTKKTTTKKIKSVRIQPKQAEPLSDELQKKLKEYPPFSNISVRPQDTTHRIVAWNVNGIRAILKRDDTLHLRAYVAQENPDIFCIGETKICEDQLQKIENFLPEYPYQYWSCSVRKGYAGTAVFCKEEPLQVIDTLNIPPDTSTSTMGDANEEGRYLALEFPKFWILHTYVPNASSGLKRLTYRTEHWDITLQTKLKELLQTKKHVLLLGDLNVAHEEIDIHDPKGNRNKSAGFTDQERESFTNLLNLGFIDTFRHFHPDEQVFSYWGARFNLREKNKGWRLDYCVASNDLLPHIKDTFIRTTVLGSDHAPIGIDLALSDK